MMQARSYLRPTAATAAQTRVASTSTFRSRVRSPFEPRLPSFGARARQALAAEIRDTAQAVRPTRLMTAAAKRAWPTFGPAPQRPAARGPNVSAPASQPAHSARLASYILRVPALLGAAVGFILDAIVVFVALIVTLPVLVIRALMQARAPQGLFIDRTALCRHSIEASFRKVLEQSAEKIGQAEEDGISDQLKKDLGRQTMRISCAPGEAPLLLPRDLETAIPQLKMLCTDPLGDVDTSWLWAVTDMSAQGLLNEVYFHLLCSGAMTFGGRPCAVSLNGDTTYTLRRLTPELVSVHAQMLAPEGVRIGMLASQTTRSSVIEDKTPLRLDIEVHIAKPKEGHLCSEVRVTQLEMGLI